MTSKTTMAFAREILADLAQEWPRHWVHDYDLQQMVEVRSMIEAQSPLITLKLTEVIPGLMCVFELGEVRLSFAQLSQIAQRRKAIQLADPIAVLPI